MSDNRGSFTFLVTTPKEQGSVRKCPGWLSSIRAHQALHQHAKKRCYYRNRPSASRNGKGISGFHSLQVGHRAEYEAACQPLSTQQVYGEEGAEYTSDTITCSSSSPPTTKTLSATSSPSHKAPPTPLSASDLAFPLASLRTGSTFTSSLRTVKPDNTVGFQPGMKGDGRRYIADDNPPRNKAYLVLSSICRPSNVLFDELPPMKSEEKNDLFKYMQFLPAELVGVSRNGSFCPIRDMIWAVVQQHYMSFEWMMMAVDTMAAEFQPRTKIRLYKRRMRVYRQMNRLLGDPATQQSDEALAATLAATCTEFQTQGDLAPLLTRAHYKGLLHVIEKRGGVGSLFGSARCMYHPLFLLVHLHFVELEVSGLSDIERCCDSFIGMMLQIQKSRQNQSGRRIFAERGLFKSVPKFTTDAEDDSLPVDDQLDPFLQGSHGSQTITERLGRFLSLYLINLMIWDFGTEKTIAEKFLLHLLRIIEDRMDPKTGGIFVSAGLLVAHVAKAWVDTQASCVWQDSGPDKEVWLTEIGIDALKVFGRLPDIWKERMLKLLASWLPVRCSGGGMIWLMDYLSEVDCEEIRYQASSDWYEKHVRDGSIM